MDRVFSNNLMGLLPIYQENIGDCTKVFLENQEPFIVDLGISTVLDQIIKYYTLDLAALKKLYSKYISSKNLIPIAFDQSNIFIAFKARKPKYANDKSFGYFNLNYLDQVHYQDPILIELRDGQVLTCISKEKSLRQHLKNGEIIRSCYQTRQMNRPRTYYPTRTQDLDIIIRELEEIKALIGK